MIINVIEVHFCFRILFIVVIILNNIKYYQQIFSSPKVCKGE